MDKFDIANPEIIEIVRQIKSIQKRISQPDLVDKTPLQIFQALETEYHDFSCKFPSIYKNIVKRKNLDTIASAPICAVTKCCVG